MRGRSRNEEGCEAVGNDLAELALGILDGDDRDRALRHLESCPQCRAEEERLSLVSDGLVELGGEVDPPVGFEVRLFERAGLAAQAKPRRPVRRSRHRRGSLQAVIAVAATALAVGAVIGTHQLWPSSGRASLATAQVTTAPLVSGGETHGQVVAAYANPSWLVMTVNDGHWSGWVACDAHLAGGRVVTLGHFQVTGGQGVWGASLPLPADQVRTISVVAPSGATLASANLRTAS